ncbi:hypothetical protein [Clostridium diolis]|uniref:hypothetical protein n=1 Tax=Clostridium diolis TaxID=223919 RepID=UPI001FA93667|nr:hypothetical protein [Clostridium diolis]
MQLSTNYGLKLPEGTDNVKRQDLIDNFSKIDSVMKEHDTHLSDIVYQTVGGSATAITLTIKGSLVNGYPMTFIASSNNGGAATTINGKKLYKPGTTTSPNLTAGKAYTVWYNSTGDCFFIKASAEGTALAKDVRKNTTFSNDNDTGIVGGLDLSLLVPGNIRAGITIDGVTGKSSVVDTADAVLDPQYLLTGYSGYDDGILKVGTMPNNGAVNKSIPINGVCTIPKGYHDGTGKVTQSIPTKAETTIMPGTTNQIIPANIYTTGIQTILGDVNLIPESILSGRSIFNITGTAILAYSTNGNFTTNVQSVGTEVSVITLGFIPDFVTVWNNAGNHRSVYESQNFQGSTYASLPIYLYGNELNGGFSFTHDIKSVSFGIKVTGNVLTFKCPYINSQTYHWFAGKLVS